MKLTYIFHSGYLIEGEGVAVVIDYWKDFADAPTRDFLSKFNFSTGRLAAGTLAVDAERGWVERLISSFKGRVYVLSSHVHPDHFNPEVLEWKARRPDIQYIFSKDILRKNRDLEGKADFLIKGKVWQDDFLKVKAFGSTDAGVSFLLEIAGKKIFHAGDLNNWHWDEESTREEADASERQYLQELTTLEHETKTLDLAMFPIDARLGKNYMRGAEQFVNRIRTKVFAPMHFGENFESANKFRSIAEAAGCRFISWTKSGESVEF